MAAVKIDCNPKRLEVKCSKETLKLNEETEMKSFFYKCVQKVNEKHLSKESHHDEDTKKCQLDSVY